MESLSWNIVATAKDKDAQRLGHRLRRFGDFWWTPFRGVMIGRVQDHEAFCEQLRRHQENDPSFLDSVAKVVPIDQTFSFTVDIFPDRLKEAVEKYVESIDGGSFYVRIERRGHHGKIHTQQLEQQLDQMLCEKLTAMGHAPTINFKDPDAIIVAETIGDVCGVGMISRTMRTRFPFVRVP
jgi:tRNA(Ser,Leu) C12 N-acetylase TAN1